MNFFKNIFSNIYEELWKAVIRPNRDNYSDKDLGPMKFSFRDKWFKRTDFSISNKKNYKLACSFWEPFDEEREYPKLPCVIYLHGNSSSRCEIIPEIKYFLPRNITVFSFDFAGCGRSEGEYISLGWNEQDDVECVVNFLRKSNKVSSIGLWGRSMGAVTALMYGSKDLSIAGLVLDSPFCSLRVLIEELAKSRVDLPNFVVNQAIKLLKEIIKDKAGFNLDDIELKQYAEKCFVPAYFCHSKGDTFVNIHHCKDLYNAYVGDKNIVYLKGNHNSERPIHFRDSVALFFYKALRCKSLKERFENDNFFNIEFKYENNIFKKRTNLNNLNNSKRKKNKSVGEMKINLKGRYDKYSSKKNENKTIMNCNNATDSSNLRRSEQEITLKSDDVSIKNIVACPNMKINSNYIKSINEMNNSNIINNNLKKSFGPSFDSSIINKTPSKGITDEDTLRKNENEKDEEEIQKILQLSKKEFEEISTNTPNFIIKKNNTKGYKKKNTFTFKKNFASSISKCKSNKNSISLNKMKGLKTKENIQKKTNINLFLVKSFNYSNKKNNQNYFNNISKSKNSMKNLNGKSKTNQLVRLSTNWQNKSNNNIIFKSIKINKTQKSTNNSKGLSFLKNCPKIFPIKLSFPNLILKIKKNTTCDYKKKGNNRYKNHNKATKCHIYNLKSQKNFKFKDNLLNEEHKSMINNKIAELLGNTKVSSLNNKICNNVDSNKEKNFQYVNTTNNTKSNNVDILNNKVRKSESSIDNDSETINHSHIMNKIDPSLVYFEDDDNFFLEDDNIEINIPNS